MEEFRDIPGYKGLYQASNMGNVKSLKFGKEKLLKLQLSTTGYFYTNLSMNGIVKKRKVHQLVAVTFLGHIPCGYQFVVDHINDDPLDNRVDNLQIVTHRFNIYKTQGKYASKYKGVTWHKVTQKWEAGIKINGKKYYLGLFEKEYDAHVAYQNKLLSLSN